ncbi:XRE family transcriptional regulator [Yersinia enterocolitica]|uniref:helix-turn-helix transcriptional regulator n=1 Tax=Yersinia enterocolitica TaxID=630 RepID=UPI002F18C160|nr:helix-turn-helix transcriptional regulator [Yersinia enterocolitica]EKN3834362.1 helix-turn-helix transcriptional regulator [Yersinia enterocolitica]EKN6352674.1 XRE family transcriptional regulator [Yersinia enterocolitica]
MNNISIYRKNLKITQLELAKACQWSGSRLANYEVGLRTPGLKDCRIIVSALNELGAECVLDEVFPYVAPTQD